MSSTRGVADIKSLAPNRRSKFTQGYYNPKNPDKYIGDLSKIIYRSAWEQKYMIYCDLSEHIIQWSSETIRIPYISPLDNKKHIYNVDFLTRSKVDNVVTTYLVEIKPTGQYMEAPVFENVSKTGKKSKKRLDTYEKEVKTFVVNQAKFLYAKHYAEDRGWKFIVVNEYDLGIK